LQTKDRTEIVILGATLEGEKRGVFETEEGQTGDQGVVQSKIGAATLLR